MVTLASLGGNVVTERADGVALRMWVTNGTTLAPGSIVTMDGQTTPDCAPPDATGEVAYGIVVEQVGATESKPDTNIADGVGVAIAPCGSGIVARVRTKTSRGAILPGDFVCHGGTHVLDATFVGVLTVDTLTIVLKRWYMIIGRATEYDADVAAVDYVETRLCH